MANYEWRENPACVATYNVTEGDNFLDQFEDTHTPFADAGKLKLGELRYFPKTTANANILELLALQTARQFLTYVVKTYTVAKEDEETQTGAIILALAGIFGDGSKTLADLAGVVDEHIRFPAEGS